MVTRFALALFALALSTHAASAETIAPAGDIAGPVLNIRTYPAHERDQPDRETLALASALLAKAGVGSLWTPCGPSRAGSACDRPLAPNELSVRFVREPEQTRRDIVSMGTSVVDTSRRAGVLATIYVDRVGQLARHTATANSVILARAIAHEVGHLLLGQEHSTQGLMRPLWSFEMVRRDVAGAWVFTPDESLRLRQALQARQER